MQINNVLSLFDGMGNGQLALHRAGIYFKKYYASEVDRHAIKVTQSNFPDTIQLGDVMGVRKEDLLPIDLLIGGSPCTGFSLAGKGLAFDDPQSKLFFEYHRLLNECKPKYFLLENVNMKNEHKDIISYLLGVEPIFINSSLVSAQNRKRLYWTNIPGIKKPKDKGILMKDIIHERDGNNAEKLEKYKVPLDKSLKLLDSEVSRGKIGYFRTNSQSNRIYSIHGKAVTLCGEAGGGAAKMGQYLFGCGSPERLLKNQNGQRFSNGKKAYTLTTQDRHGVLLDGYIRKLTPIECERLQTVPDNYTALASDAQRYKMLGNGWTVDVIAHMLRNIDMSLTAEEINSKKRKVRNLGLLAKGILNGYKSERESGQRDTV